MTGDRHGPANPATVPGSTTPTVAPVQKSNQASVKGLRDSPLVWAGATRLVRDAAPRSSRAFAQTSPIASSGLTPQEAQTGRSPRAWLIGLIWFIWCVGCAWLVWFIWFNHLHTTPHTHHRTVDGS